MRQVGGSNSTMKSRPTRSFSSNTEVSPFLMDKGPNGGKFIRRHSTAHPSKKKGAGNERACLWACLSFCLLLFVAAVLFAYSLHRGRRSEGGVITVDDPEPHDSWSLSKTRSSRSDSRYGTAASQGSLSHQHSCHNFVIFTRQRSASTTMVEQLNTFPRLHCSYEVFNHFKRENMGGKLFDMAKSRLGLRDHNDLEANIPEFIDMMWDTCKSFTEYEGGCGFKLMDNHIHFERIPRLFYRENSSLIASPSVSVRAIVLERVDVRAAYASWYRAITTGNWGTSPKKQEDFNTEKGYINMELANSHKGSYVKFESDHINWFNTVRSFLYSNKIPMLNIKTEEFLNNQSATLEVIRDFLCEPDIGERPLCDHHHFTSGCDGLTPPLLRVGDGDIEDGTESTKSEDDFDGASQLSLTESE